MTTTTDTPDAEDKERCVACDEALKDGDLVYSESGEGGFIHAACCGPDRDSYVGADGEPLKPGDPIPEPMVFKHEWHWRSAGDTDHDLKLAIADYLELRDETLSAEATTEQQRLESAASILQIVETHRRLADAALQQRVTALETALAAYFRAIDSDPELDCEDDGERFASDWSHREHDQKRWAAGRHLRAVLTEGQFNG